MVQVVFSLKVLIKTVYIHLTSITNITSHKIKLKKKKKEWDFQKMQGIS